MLSASKTCSMCGAAKRIERFYLDRRAKDGHQSRCADCHNATVARSPKNIERRRASVRRWHQKNPNRVREINAAAHARRRGAATIHDVTIDDLAADDCGFCRGCGRPLGDEWHWDHVTRISQGGEHTLANSQRLHPACHRAKTMTDRRSS